MAYRVDITERGERDLERLYLTIKADSSEQARIWFNGLERSVMSLDEHPARAAPIPEGGALRHLLYGRKGHRYRVIYSIEEASRIVTVLHIRHGARDAFQPDELDDRKIAGGSQAAARQRRAEGAAIAERARSYNLGLAKTAVP